MRKAAWKTGAKGFARPLARMARHWSWKIQLLLDPGRRAAEVLRAKA